jgi:hypothetical protein
MSFWIHAFCNETVASVTPHDLKNGIAQRLKLLTFLFCPEQEEDPDVVLNRLRIEDHSKSDLFQEYRMYYRPNSPTFIHIGRNDQTGIVELERNVLSTRHEPGIQNIRQMLVKATEDVVFCLKAHDVAGMGFPLSIAAAAYLVEQKGGLIQSGTYSWMVPVGKEVKTILEVEV